MLLLLRCVLVQTVVDSTNQGEWTTCESDAIPAASPIFACKWSQHRPVIEWAHDAFPF
jgi:hypothetical protein